MKLTKFFQRLIPAGTGSIQAGMSSTIFLLVSSSESSSSGLPQTRTTTLLLRSSSPLSSSLIPAITSSLCSYPKTTIVSLHRSFSSVAGNLSYSPPPSSPPSLLSVQSSHHRLTLQPTSTPPFCFSLSPRKLVSTVESSLLLHSPNRDFLSPPFFFSNHDSLHHHPVSASPSHLPCSSSQASPKISRKPPESSSAVVGVETRVTNPISSSDLQNYPARDPGSALDTTVRSSNPARLPFTLLKPRSDFKPNLHSIKPAIKLEIKSKPRENQDVDLIKTRVDQSENLSL